MYIPYRPAVTLAAVAMRPAAQDAGRFDAEPAVTFADHGQPESPDDR